VVLLDEPLTAAEPRAKWQLRQTLKRLQQELSVTMIYVTHDQTEALTFAERVGVMTDGEILQTASPQEVYEYPAHEFVGFFIGSPGMNLITIDAAEVIIHSISGVDPSTRRIGFRPEWARLQRCLDASAVPPVSWLGRVSLKQILGTQHGEPVGITVVQTQAGEINVRGPIKHETGDEVVVRVDRFITFSSERYMATHYVNQ
jgi:glycerol transport system ATP-binding protein